MTGLQQVLIGGYPSGGWMTDRKPLMLPDQAFSNLENAYVWRQRTKKRDGQTSISQLQRVINNGSIAAVTSGVQFNLFSSLTVPITPEPYAQIAPGSVTIYLNPTTSTGNLGIGSAPMGGGTIYGYTNASNCQCYSAAHGLSTGQIITIAGVVVSSGDNLINGGPYIIEVTDVNTFKLQSYPDQKAVDSTFWGKWQSGGTWTLISSPIKLIDQGNGTLATSPTSASTGIINYVTGNVTLTFAGGPFSAKVYFGYYPNLPVMGIGKQDVFSNPGIDRTIYFDTKYAYQFTDDEFQQVGTKTWSAPNQDNGSNTNFFWTTNYFGFFWATNNYINPQASAKDPIRYYVPSASDWTDFQPIISVSGMTNTYLFQTLILIPYYGRLLALNTWEGTANSSGNVTNLFNRCRFSALGDPTDSQAWRQDIFGKGGFLDAPTSEEIVGAAFFRNTLIVFFEYSTWQIRYLGEYGTPFIFERVSSDFGAVSTYSSLVFDQGVMTVSDRGIMQAGANGIKRLDEQIPDLAFDFEIFNNAPNFVHGARDYQKEIVYWNYYDKTSAEKTQVYPNAILLFNYKNNTWAKFRDNITCFGTAQFDKSITWDSLTTIWDDTDVTWDTGADQDYTNFIVAGNQNGMIQVFENQNAVGLLSTNIIFGPALSIYAVTFIPNQPTQFTIQNHNLTNGEIVYITGMQWLNSPAPNINNQLFYVNLVTDTGTDEQKRSTITLSAYNFTSQSYVPQIFPSNTYIGGGYVALCNNMSITTKDFSPFQGDGLGFKLAFVDFQLDSNNYSPGVLGVSVNLTVNSDTNYQANMLIGNQEVLNNTTQSNIITAATKANPCQITCKDHCLETGDQVYISGVQGMIQLNAANYTITVVDADNFTLNVDSSGFSTYTGGGIWNQVWQQGMTYQASSQYAWYRFYSTQFGQYLRIALDYDDLLMNQVATHQSGLELNAMNCWMRKGGRSIN